MSDYLCLSGKKEMGKEIDWISFWERKGKKGLAANMHHRHRLSSFSFSSFVYKNTFEVKEELDRGESSGHQKWIMKRIKFFLTSLYNKRKVIIWSRIVLGSFLLKCTLNSFNVSMFSSIVSKGSFFPKWLLCAFNLLPRANCDRIKQILLFHLSAIFLRKDITRGRLRLFACDTLITKLLSSSVWLYCLDPFSSSLWLYCLDSFSSSFWRNYFN